MQKNKLYQHLKKIVYKCDSRPVLQCVQYHTDGSLRATDSHVMLKIKDFHNLEIKQPILQNIFTMEFETERAYPNTDRHFDRKGNSNKLVVSLSVLKRIITALKEGSFSNVVEIELSENHLKMTNNHQNSEIPIVIDVACSYTDEPMKIGFSADVLLRMVNFMLDAKNRYEVDDVTIHLDNSPVVPALCEIQEGKYQFIVTPVRMN